VAHISDDDLERYAMLMLGEAEIGRLEEHLLICPECRERLEETERYVVAMRAAAAKIRDSESSG
jgi:anti-sigma factor RsiW